MPKAFSNQEKEVIRGQLRAKGKALFEAHGLRKTSIDELAQAAGISKGAFYLFYESKEELFMDILEALEADFRARVFHFAATPSTHARRLLSKFLKDALLTWDKYPLLKNFRISDYEYLGRKISPQRLKQHVNQDDVFIKDFIRRIGQQGVNIKASPRVVSNLTKSLFFITLHRADLDEAGYLKSMEILTDLVAGYITENGDGRGN